MVSGVVLPLFWAQASVAGAGAAVGGGGPSSTASNPAALASLALRRWFSGLTLCSPQAAPDLHGLWVFGLGLAALLALAMLVQGPGLALRQVLALPAHIGLVRRATARVWKAGRLVAAAIAFTVLAWTGAQTLAFLGERAEKGRADLTVLTRSRARGELALDQGLLAALTPLRDVAGLGDNVPLLLLAVYLVFRASSGPLPPVTADLAPSRAGSRARGMGGWSNGVWCCGSLYVLYRLAARFLGSPELPIGGCLVIEAVIVPSIMLICDGFLLAWVLAELRDAVFDTAREDRFQPAAALELMPAAGLACAVALPARYVAALVLLSYQQMPTTVISSPVGRFIRWQLGWGLIDVQAAALPLLGLVGVVAWGRGGVREAVHGFGRLLRLQGGHLVALVALAGAASFLLAAPSYLLILLLPPAGWVLPAADSYSHYLTLPAGLWTLAALIDLAQRALPVARLAGAEDDQNVAVTEDEEEASVPAPRL